MPVPGRVGAVPTSVGDSSSSAKRSLSGFIFARPKSRIFTPPERVRKMFSGLRSRWVMPRAWPGRGGRGARAGRDLRGELDGPLLRERAARAQAVAQRLPFEQLEDDVEGVAVLAEVVDGDEVRVIEQAERARLLLEARDDLLGVAAGNGREELDGDVAGELGVARAIDLSHASRADE